MSDGEQESLSEVEEPSAWLIPLNLSIDNLDKIVKACFSARADTTPVSYQDVVTRAGIHVATVAPNLRFLTSVGILQTDKARKTFTFTSKGVEYAKSLGGGDLTRAGQILKELLPSSHLNELLGYMEVQGAGLAYDGLFNQIKTLSRAKEDANGRVRPTVSAGIRCLMALLIRAGFANESILRQVEERKPVASTGRKGERQVKESGSEGKIEPIQPVFRIGGNAPLTPFNLNITVEAKDPESIKQRTRSPSSNSLS
jgi:predicted transcriptional regulator